MIRPIRDRDAFERIRSNGVRLRAETLWCSYLPDPAVTPPCVGFAIGRSTGNAVVRNRLRRRLREILRASDVPSGWFLFGATHRRAGNKRSDPISAHERSYVELAVEVDQILTECRSIAA